jgi:uncharacterized membrane protein YbhN (UPF0104 family)
MDLSATASVLRGLPLSAVLVYAATMVPTHLFRAWRWKYLLRPVGVSLSFGRLMTISTVGFMAILALPFRLGEFARPYYVVRGGQSRMSALLGTVAVERIVDGLVLSILFFVTYVLAFRAGGAGLLVGSGGRSLAIPDWLSLSDDLSGLRPTLDREDDPARPGSNPSATSCACNGRTPGRQAACLDPWFSSPA